MDRDELKHSVALEISAIRRSSMEDDEGAERILSLITPELKKAKKWDRVKRFINTDDPCDKCPLLEPCMKGRYCLVGLLEDAIESEEVEDD